MDYKKIFKNKQARVRFLNHLGFLPDKLLLKIEYRIKTGEKLNLKNPILFTEKLQWLKLNDRKDIYTTMVDKFAMKKFVADRVGEEYVVPLLGSWNKFEDIDFDVLPQQFVLKCTHDSGSIIFCHNKETFDKDFAKKSIDQHLRTSAYKLGREWPYKNVPRKIIAEKMLFDSNNSDIKDYKWFCFNGQPKVMYISNDKGADPRTDFFDMEFNHLPITMKDPNAEIIPEKPVCFNEMYQIAAKLSEGCPHLRVDFYLIGTQIYVGELTFFHNSGFTPISPKEWNLRMGDWIDLSIINKNKA